LSGRPSGAFSRTGLSAPDRASVNRLEHLMAAERTYRQEELTIGLLAVRLGMPEYRLRALINDAPWTPDSSRWRRSTARSRRTPV
jgi:hypothetical protein